MSKRLTVLVAFGLLTSLSAFGQEWLNGVYVNQDASPDIESVNFCVNGHAVVDNIVQRTYTISQKNGKTTVFMSSNGDFSFFVSKDKKTLLPADEFTRNWFTATGLKLDSKSKADCN